jgi:hypothetical protein
VAGRGRTEGRRLAAFKAQTRPSTNFTYMKPVGVKCLRIHICETGAWTAIPFDNALPGLRHRRANQAIGEPGSGERRCRKWGQDAVALTTERRTKHAHMHAIAKLAT